MFSNPITLLKSKCTSGVVAMLNLAAVSGKPPGYPNSLSTSGTNFGHI
jgi:hypothetical protein